MEKKPPEVQSCRADWLALRRPGIQFRSLLKTESHPRQSSPCSLNTPLCGLSSCPVSRNRTWKFHHIDLLGTSAGQGSPGWLWEFAGSVACLGRFCISSNLSLECFLKPVERLPLPRRWKKKDPVSYLSGSSFFPRRRTVASLAPSGKEAEVPLSNTREQAGRPAA